jgi:hypothetical protein
MDLDPSRRKPKPIRPGFLRTRLQRYFDLLSVTGVGDL